MCSIQYAVTVITRPEAEIKGQKSLRVIAFHLKVIWGWGDDGNQ